LPAWANFMKKSYTDPSLKLENLYFPMPDNVIAVPSAGSSESPDVLNNNVYVEYYTPKAYARSQAGDFNSSPAPVNSGAIGNPDSTGLQQAPVPQAAPSAAPPEPF